MNSVSLMEWTGKAPVQWDWEMMFNATMTENKKKLQAKDWEIDGEREIRFGSFYLSGVGSGSSSGSGGSGSDLELASLSKRSKSASISPSSVRDEKTSKFTLETSEHILQGLNNNTELVITKSMSSSPVPRASVGSGEPLLSLKLGKRAYFEDACTRNNMKNSSFFGNPVSATLIKRSKSTYQGAVAPHCQVEGCNLDLSSAKDYHRKHRVCENHSKCPRVIVAGLERRFCQQCSRFHGLSEFDEKKRSCRRRLSDHNARRRKPQAESVHLNPSRLCSSFYDDRQQVALVWNRPATVHSTPNADFSWESASNSKFTVTKEYVMKPAKVAGIDVQLHLPVNDLSNSVAVHCHDSTGLLPSKAKGGTATILNQGLDESVIFSTVDTTQDLHRALSLLSTSSWGSGEQKPVSLEQPMQTLHGSMSQSALHVMNQGLPFASSEYWRTDQESTVSKAHTLTSHSDGNCYFQEFQSKAPYESDFFSGQLN